MAIRPALLSRQTIAEARLFRCRPHSKLPSLHGRRFWNPVLFVIYIAEQREIGLGLNTHLFEFDCFFAHEATFNGRSAVGLGVFSLTILQQQIIAGFDRLVRRCSLRRRTRFWGFAC